jgi:hypothetical protein
MARHYDQGLSHQNVKTSIVVATIKHILILLLITAEEIDLSLEMIQ